MKYWIILTLAFVSGCGSYPDSGTSKLKQEVSFINEYDMGGGVVCFKYTGYGISCLYLPGRYGE
jgi:hypothetical protein